VEVDFKLKITGLKCAVIAQTPVVRITTDEGIDGLGQIEASKNYLKPHVLFYERFILGEDPTNVQRITMKLRRFGGFKPWGSSVSAIEMALWDIAGKAAGLPVYKLLGGKVRDKVRVYNTATGPRLKGYSPEDYAENAREKLALPHGFKIFKFPLGFHGGMFASNPKFFYGEVETGYPHPNKGYVTELGLKHCVECVKALKEVLGEEYGLALDCGPGFPIPSAIKLAKALEPFNVMWLEDLITGDYYPYTEVEAFRIVKSSTTTPIHTGEQIYLREGFRDLIERNAVDIIGPDPCDAGGIAETKWIAELADLHGVLIAPHSGLNGPIELMAAVHMAATLPKNFIALEFPFAPQEWWEGNLVKGLEKPVVKDGFVEVPDKPGLGIELNEKAVRKVLREEDKDFFE